MNVADVRAELEDELTRRLNDMRFFKNMLAACATQDERDKFCKCLVVMLYAQFEGFWKAAFSIYLNAINREGIRCGDATDALVAASMADVFHALTDTNRKCDFFRSNAPDDSQLHRFARHTEFAGRVGEVAQATVSVPIDLVVNTESNLSPVIVRKNLYRLGFGHDEFSSQEGAIKWLIDRRNDVAHGTARLPIDEEEYEKIEPKIILVMNNVVTLIFEAILQQRYLKSVPA